MKGFRTFGIMKKKQKLCEGKLGTYILVLRTTLVKIFKFRKKNQLAKSNL